MNGDLRQLVIITLNLNQSCLRNRCLCQLRRPLIEGQHIRVAMAVECSGNPGLQRIIPGTCRQLHDALAKIIRYHDTRETMSSAVKDTNDVARNQITGFRIHRIH